RGVFREPFCRQTLGGETQGGFFRHRHLRSHEQMRHVRHARDAVAKGKPRAGVPDEKLERRECEAVGHGVSLRVEQEQTERTESITSFSVSSVSSCSFFSLFRQRVRSWKKVISSAAAQIPIAPLGQRGDFAVGNRAFQHPKTETRMHVAHAIRSEHLFSALDDPGDFLRRLDVVHLDRLINEPAALNTTFEILFWTLDASSTYEICCS